MAKRERKKVAAAPISRHPLFPVIVALWVGALFGLCSILVSPTLIERMVLATGIDGLIPAAKPPLGSTARVLLALGMTSLGTLIGLIIARRIGVADPVHERSRRLAPMTVAAAEPVEESAPADTIVTAPLPTPAALDPALQDASAPQEAATKPESSEPADAAPLPSAKSGGIPGRRRALALDTQTDRATYEDRAPVPGIDPQILNVAEFEIASFDHDEDAPDSTAPVKAGVTAKDATARPAWLEAESARHEPAADSPQAPDFRQAFQPQIDSASGAVAMSATATKDSAIASGHKAELPRPGFKLLSRLDTSPPRGGDDAPEMAAVAAAARQSATEDAMPPASGNEDVNVPDAETRGAGRIAQAELADLSTVELVKRLALAMAARRTQPPHPADTAPSAPAADFVSLRDVSPQASPSSPRTFGRLVSAPAAEPFAGPVIGAPKQEALSPSGTPEAKSRQSIPAALRPVGSDMHEHGEADDALPAWVPQRHIRLSAVKSTSAANPLLGETVRGDREEAEDLQQGYSSLRDLSRPAATPAPFGKSAARSTEPSLDAASSDDTAPANPVAAAGKRLFDAPGRSEEDAAEDALRTALATLRRMSGAA